MLAPSQNKPKLSFDTVFYYVRDIERSVSFYRDILGLTPVSRDFVARFDLDGVLIELVPAPRGMMLPGNGNARLCLAVSDLEEARKQLRACGITASPTAHKKGGELAFFCDPDGNELCLWQYDMVAGPKEVVKAAQLQR